MLDLFANHKRDWIFQAECAKKGMDPSMWEIVGHRITRENRQAIQICRRDCPVMEQCFLETLENPGAFEGTIRGGEVQTSTRAIRKRKRSTKTAA